ncbi:MAG: MarR family transcriptional regulator [Patulibacter minatonensis]
MQEHQQHLDPSGLDAPLPTAFHDRLALLLVRTGDRIAVRGSERLEAALGIDGADYTALAVISQDAPRSQQELAQLLCKAPAMCVGLLDALEASGLVARERDPKDRRRSIVTLTAAGREVLAKADAIAAEVEAEAIEGLTDAERDRLLAVLLGPARAGAAAGA